MRISRGSSTAMKSVFESLSPLLKDQSLVGGLKMIFTAHRPSLALADAYPGSPFNIGKEHIFARFDANTCKRLAIAAGLNAHARAK